MLRNETAKTYYFEYLRAPLRPFHLIRPCIVRHEGSVALLALEEGGIGLRETGGTKESGMDMISDTC